MNNDELQKFAESTNKKMGLISTILARQAARTKQTTPEEAAEQKPSIINSGDNVLKALNSSMNVIASSLKRINTSLSKLSAIGEIGAVPAAAPTPAGTSKPVEKEKEKSKEEGLSGLLSSLFSNPAVIAAFSGLLYTILPKEVQAEIKGLFSGFSEGLESAIGKSEEEGAKGFGTAVKTAGIVIGTIFGAKLLSSVASAIMTTVKIIRLVGAGGKFLGKMGVAGGVIAGAAAYAGSKLLEGDETTDEESQPEKTITTETTTTKTEEKPAAAGLKPSGGVGIKPGGEFGIKVPPPPEIKDIISKASKMVGVDESTMIAVARQESGFNPSAKAGTSSAKGLYQFVDATWNEMVRKYGAQYPELNKGPMDPLASAIAGALYIKENSRILEKAGLPVNPTNLYALHFLGAGGGPKLLNADPNAVAAEILPRAAEANKSVFYNKDGSPKTVKDVVQFLYGKVGSYAEAYASGNMPEREPGKATAQPVKTASATTGSEISTASMNMRALITAPEGETAVASVDNSSTRSIGADKARSSAPIPSPIANRGSLNGYVKHSTSYA